MRARPMAAAQRRPAISAGDVAAPRHGATTMKRVPMTLAMAMAMTMPGPIAEACDGAGAGHHGE